MNHLLFPREPFWLRDITTPDMIFEPPHQELVIIMVMV